MRSRSLLLLILLSLCAGGLSCSTPPSLKEGTSGDSGKAKDLSADRLMEQGALSFKNGAFASAVSAWEEAARLFDQAGNSEKSCEALTKLSQAYQGSGQHHDALKEAQKALSLAKKRNDDRQTAEALGLLGNIRLSLGETEKAQGDLEEALKTAERLAEPDLTARVLNTLGNLFAAQERDEDALRAYQKSASLSQGRGVTAAAAAINSASAYFRVGNYNETLSRVEEALPVIRGLEDSYPKAHALINAGLLCGDLRPHLPDRKTRLTALSAEALAQAVRVGQAIGDPRTLSYAYGYLGNLYETEGRSEGALTLTTRAVYYAQRSQAPESLYRWYWQSGRVLRSMGKTADAIAAYRQALGNLQTIRKDMAVCYGDSEASLRSTAALLCSQYVDLLLEVASSAEDTQRYLSEAREALELVKVFELRDYFKDDCVDAARYVETKLDFLSGSALIVYPILLKNRLELLVRFPDSLRRYTVNVSEEDLTREVRDFRSKIEKRTTGEFLPHARTLYDWLVRPYEKDLAAFKIDTLVFVPDGPLRTIPMAALHNGKTFLIEEYATAITPGLNLTDPRPMRKDQIKVLTFGLTESVQDFPALPYVSAELQGINQVFSGRSLLNQDFVASRLEQELKRGPFSILHIASHGHFGNDVEDTFVLAFDTRLTMDRLGEYVGLFRFREEPLDLLTLSACETAAGDDRAALGLAGIAIRAGARSALATLWQVNDPASYKLVVEFYRQIRNPGTSRASALQAAQLELLKDPRYSHPCYWAPFLLINNWL
jgi:CHAT domain-containing protein/predicted negative regulator of RcsB-dependent stress response